MFSTNLVLDPLLDPLDHGVGGLAEVGLVPLEQLREDDGLAVGVHVDALGVLQEGGRRQVKLLLDLEKPDSLRWRKVLIFARSRLSLVCINCKFSEDILNY